MKRISARIFFMVLWRGLCQALGWFFGLFGYKRDGKFAKCVWGLFATSGSIVMTLFALSLLCCIGESVYNRWIVALDHDLYLCASKNGDKVIVNGKGENVR